MKKYLQIKRFLCFNLSFTNDLPILLESLLPVIAPE